jgi:uncharacterized protein (DUF4415 family)
LWDGQGEDDSPLTADEQQAGLLAARRRGCPAGSGVNEQVAIRFDRDALADFPAESAGW